MIQRLESYHPRPSNIRDKCGDQSGGSQRRIAHIAAKVKLERNSMRIRQPGVLWALALSATCASAAVIGASVPAPSITPDRIVALPRARQAAWRTYMARSVPQMRADRAFLQAELKTAGLASELVPPSGSASCSMPLNQPPEWYGSAEARRIADITVSFQTPAGGWSKNLNLKDHVRRPGESFAPNNLSAHLGPDDFDTPHDPKWNYVGTLDNDATTTELHFLAKVAGVAAQDVAAYRASVLRGLEYLLAAQFPNGGWPQVWPLEGGYHDAITFNDGAVTLTLELLQQVADRSREFGFVPESLRARTRASVAKGIRCILAAQIAVHGQRTVWAQQHDALTLEPVAGRNYEPAAQCASESAALVLFLMKLPQPDPEVVEAVHRAVAWFRKTAIPGKAYQRGPDERRLVSVAGAAPIWARFYEIGTDRAIFGDRDKSIHDDVNEISAERRNGYSWYNSGPQEALDRYAEWSAGHPVGKK
jgi:PelA/Pel-15E family pectate lyase